MLQQLHRLFNEALILDDVLDLGQECNLLLQLLYLDLKVKGFHCLELSHKLIKLLRVVQALQVLLHLGLEQLYMAELVLDARQEVRVGKLGRGIEEHLLGLLKSPDELGAACLDKAEGWLLGHVLTEGAQVLDLLLTELVLEELLRTNLPVHGRVPNIK